MEAERYFAEIIRKTIEKYSSDQAAPVIDDVIGSYVELQMSKKHQ